MKKIYLFCLISFGAISIHAQITPLAGGGRHSLFICPDSTVRGMGDGAPNGTGACVSTNVPMTVTSLSSVKSVCGGYDHSLFLKNDGTVWSVGVNAKGQLGTGNTTATCTPTQISGLSGVIAIDCGYMVSVALKSDGTVWTWGLNDHGQLGIGNNTDSNVPVQVSGLSSITAISMIGIDNKMFALKSDSTVWAWGSNLRGGLGDGTTTDRSTLVQVNGLTGVAKLAPCLVIKGNGTVWSWGGNFSGEVGDGTNTDRYTPVQITSLTNSTAVERGTSTGIALQSNGTVWLWGGNSAGQLGNGTNTDTNTPAQVSGLSNIVAIAGGGPHTLCLQNDGTIWGTGRDVEGQLGDADNTNKNTFQHLLWPCSPAGVSETNRSAFNLFPNPATAEIHFSNEIEILKIYDLLGNELSVHYRVKSLDLQSMVAGTYFYRAFADAKWSTGKFSVSK